MSKSSRENFTIRMTIELQARLRMQAKLERVSASDLLERLVLAYLKDSQGTAA